MHLAALCGSQGWNSLRSLSPAPGCFSSPEGGEMSICVCLLELSSGASCSERGGSLRLSLGLGALRSTGTRVIGPSSSLLCARAKPARHNVTVAIMRIRSRTFLFYCNPNGRATTPSGTVWRNPIPFDWDASSTLVGTCPVVVFLLSDTAVNAARGRVLVVRLVQDRSADRYGEGHSRSSRRHEEIAEHYAAPLGHELRMCLIGIGENAKNS